MIEPEGMFMAPLEDVVVTEMMVSACEAEIVLDNGADVGDVQPPSLLHLSWETMSGAAGSLVLTMDQAADVAGAMLELAMYDKYTPEQVAALTEKVDENVRVMRDEMGLGGADLPDGT